MLCQLCSSIDLDQLTTQEGYQHHSSWADLKASAKSGCPFCTAISSSFSSQPFLPLPDRIELSKGVKFRARYWISLINKAGIKDIDVINLESNRIEEFLVFTTPDDPLASVVSSRPYSPSLESTLEVIKGWTETCRSHESCSQDQYSKFRLPTRVIDVGSGSSVVPVLFESQGRLGEWITLSHCWGNVQPVTLTTSNINARRAGIPLDTLSPLFRDAVVITRGLGYRYLWIDSLCILQDSHEDWTSEAADMGYIFKHSSLTIAAQASQDCHDGILSSSNRDWPDLSKWISLPCHSSNRRLSGKVYVQRSSKAPQVRNFLRNRAWTLQEEILPARVVDWNSRGLQWRCRSAHYDEDLSYGRGLEYRDLYNIAQIFKRVCLSRSAFDDSRLTQRSFHSLNLSKEAMRIWYNILSNYMSRAITHHADRLPALSGVAREIARLTGYRYLAGLWKEDMISCLLWSTSDMPARRLESNPSWSWISIEIDTSSISPTERTSFSSRSSVFKPLIEILGVNVQLASEDTFGQIKSARLHIRGLIGFLPNPGSFLGGLSWEEASKKINWKMDCFSDFEDLDFLDPNDFTFLQVSHTITAAGLDPPIEAEAVICLVLTPTGDNDVEFNRVGLAYVPQSLMRGRFVVKNIAIV